MIFHNYCLKSSAPFQDLQSQLDKMTKECEKERSDREFEYHVRQKLRVSLEKAEDQLQQANRVISELRGKLAVTTHSAA